MKVHFMNKSKDKESLKEFKTRMKYSDEDAQKFYKIRYGKDALSEEMKKKEVPSKENLWFGSKYLQELDEVIYSLIGHENQDVYLKGKEELEKNYVSIEQMEKVFNDAKRTIKDGDAANIIFYMSEGVSKTFCEQARSFSKKICSKG